MAGAGRCVLVGGPAPAAAHHFARDIAARHGDLARAGQGAVEAAAGKHGGARIVGRDRALPDVAALARQVGGIDRQAQDLPSADQREQRLRADLGGHRTGDDQLPASPASAVAAAPENHSAAAPPAWALHPALASGAGGPASARWREWKSAPPQRPACQRAVAPVWNRRQATGRERRRTAADG
jgi:hypothetical protein